MLILPEVDKSFIHGANQCSEIEKFLENSKTHFEHKLIGNLSHINHRAESHNGIYITSVQHHSNNKYYLEYNYDWDIYNGCADMDEEGTEFDRVLFSINDTGEIEFDYPKLEKRSTYNEF